MLISINNVCVFAGVLVNGSFEADGWIDDIALEEPNGWDVNLPSNFGGWIYNDWVTDGSFNLTVSSFWYTDFVAGDKALVSQQVILDDVNQIIFDVKLDTYPDYVWNPDVRTVAVMIDDKVVWSSDIFGEDVRGEYFAEVIDVNIEDGQPQILSLALISDVSQEWFDVDTMYYVYWDLIGIDTDCRGLGFLSSDFNQDCVVNQADMEDFTKVWLEILEADSRFNLYKANDTGDLCIIDFLDFAVFSQQWLKTSYD